MAAILFWGRWVWLVMVNIYLGENKYIFYSVSFLNTVMMQIFERLPHGTKWPNKWHKKPGNQQLWYWLYSSKVLCDTTYWSKIWSSRSTLQKPHICARISNIFGRKNDLVFKWVVDNQGNEISGIMCNETWQILLFIQHFEAQWCIYALVKIPSLVQIIACHLDGTNPLSKPMLEYC